MRSFAWVAIASLVATLAAPVAVADHCNTKIYVYGRVSPTPVAPPPYSSSTAGMCLRVFNGTGVEEHVLPPNTDEVFVRVQGDYGPSILSVDARLDGLGFVAQHFALVRTLNPAGGYSYNLPDWLALPNGPMDGSLTVTITQPGGSQRSITYTTTLTLPSV